ncbi:rhodanese-like domain-containing protein [Bacillus timonensis]|nr:rhodanese-like domain-containing protein [Bacillus timonensis]
MRRMLVGVVMIMALFLAGNYLFGQNDSSLTSISTAELAEKMKDKSEDVFYVDVREPSEYEEGHIEGMTNVPLSTLKDNYEVIPKDKEVVLICRSGNRSMQAATILEELGYPRIVNVDGGMLSWQGEVVTE